MSRKRRGSLRGWWRYLPFVLAPFGLLFSEVWFQTQILNNEYRKNALRENIRQSEARLDEMHDEVRELARMERVLEHAPNLGLVPPSPGQVVEVQLAQENESSTVVAVVPSLAAPPKREAPKVASKTRPPVEESAPVLEELDILEPEVEWVN